MFGSALFWWFYVLLILQILANTDVNELRLEFNQMIEEVVKKFDHFDSYQNKGMAGDFKEEFKEIGEVIERKFDRFDCYHSELHDKVSVIKDTLEASVNCTQSPEAVQPTIKELSCILTFGSASFGNLGLAGAGAFLLPEDGSPLYVFREGLGNQTKEVAEYRAFILGLKQAVRKGCTNITVRGDSQLLLVQGMWKCRVVEENVRGLCVEALILRTHFQPFHIEYVSRELSYGAVENAYLAIEHKDGEVEEDNVTLLELCQKLLAIM